MDLLTILVIAVGLSMDAFAVSIVSGAGYKKFEIKHTLVMAVSFGAFQAFMPIAGWSAGLFPTSYSAIYSPFLNYLYCLITKVTVSVNMFL